MQMITDLYLERYFGIVDSPIGIESANRGGSWYFWLLVKHGECSTLLWRSHYDASFAYIITKYTNKYIFNSLGIYLNME